MLRLVLQLANPWRGILAVCDPSLTLLMDVTLSLDLGTRLFGDGMPGLVRQLASPWRGTPSRCSPLPTLLMGGASSLDLSTIIFEFGILRLALQLETL